MSERRRDEKNKTVFRERFIGESKCDYGARDNKSFEDFLLCFRFVA